MRPPGTPAALTAYWLELERWPCHNATRNNPCIASTVSSLYNARSVTGQSASPTILAPWSMFDASVSVQLERFALNQPNARGRQHRLLGRHAAPDPRTPQWIGRAYGARSRLRSDEHRGAAGGPSLPCRSHQRVPVPSAPPSDAACDLAAAPPGAGRSRPTRHSGRRLRRVCVARV